MQNIDYKKEEFETILQLSQSGDEKALEELIKRIQQNVFIMFSYLTDKKQDVYDLTQEALLKTALNIKSVKNLNNFKQWLNQIITNTFYDYIRKNSKNTNLDFDDKKLLEIKDKIGCEPGEKCLFSEMDKIIKIAILSLPRNLRIAIILREYEGLSYNDISKLTNTTIGTVKSRISRARIKLQQALKEFI